MTFSAPLDNAIDLAALRRRTSEKWAHYAPDVLPVFVAESDFPLAPAIARTLHEAIDRGDLGYAQPRGLSEAYAEFAAARYGEQIEPRDVIAVPEVMIGVAEVLRAGTKPGDAVVINGPVYPPFFSTIEEVERTVVNAPLMREGGRYVLDLRAVEAAFAAGARVHLLCNPHNPVGRVYTRAELGALAALARQYGVLVISDEIHAPLTLPGTTFTPFSLVAKQHGVDAITLTSASKGWNVAGLKCALAIAHSDRAREIFKRLPAAMTDRTGHLGVHASIAALREGVAYLDDVVAHLDAIRANLRGIFDAAGLSAVQFDLPEAGYLAWLDCSALYGGDNPAAAFLKSGNVALHPGVAFGPQGRRYARFNFATSTAIVTEAARRMRAALDARTGV